MYGVLTADKNCSAPCSELLLQKDNVYIIDKIIN